MANVGGSSRIDPSHLNLDPACHLALRLNVRIQTVPGHELSRRVKEGVLPETFEALSKLVLAFPRIKQSPVPRPNAGGEAVPFPTDGPLGVDRATLQTHGRRCVVRRNREESNSRFAATYDLHPPRALDPAAKIPQLRSIGRVSLARPAFDHVRFELDARPFDCCRKGLIFAALEEYRLDSKKIRRNFQIATTIRYEKGAQATHASKRPETSHEEAQLENRVIPRRQTQLAAADRSIVGRQCNDRKIALIEFLLKRLDERETAFESILIPYLRIDSTSRVQGVAQRVCDIQSSRYL